MKIDGPIILHQDYVRSEWVDEYDHMNLAYYVLVCDQATYAFWELINEGQSLEHREGLEYAVVETHVNYLQEVRLNDPVVVTTQLLGYDQKRFHIFHELRHADRGFLSATNEVMALGFDLNSRKIQPFRKSVQQQLMAIADHHNCLEVPANAGRSIRLKKPATSD